MTRGETFMTAVSVLLTGRNLEIVGERGSGRTYLLRRLQEHFTTLGWTVLTITGMESFQRANFAAINLAGFIESTEQRVPPVTAAYHSIESSLGKGPSLLIIDDADSLDDASWGVISAVSTRRNVPIASARLRNGSKPAGTRTVPSLVSTFTQQLSPMSYAELEAQLSSSLGARIEPSTMSRVYAKTGGNIGIALTVIEAANHAGTFQISGGLARSTGQMWTPALGAMVENILGSLGSEHLASVRALALLGPIACDSARKVVDEAEISVLEESSFVTTVTAGTRRIVTVNPPLLIDYFRQELHPGQHATFLNDLDEALDIEPTLTHNSPVFVQVVHEQARLRTLRARLAWVQQPTLPHATAFLSALTADISDVSDEIETFLHDVAFVDGTPRERAEFEVAYADHIVNQHASRLNEAVDRLAAAALALPSEAVWLNARCSLLRVIFHQVPAEFPLNDVLLEDLPHDTRVEVLVAHAQWLLLRGRVREASEILAGSSGWEEARPHLAIVNVVCHLAMGDIKTALQISSELLETAQKSFSGPGIRIASFLTALSAISERRFDDAETIVEDAIAIGFTSGESVISYIGMIVLAAYTSARRGQRVNVGEYFSALDASGYPDTALPVQQRAWVLARMHILDGDPEGAARLCREAADGLWDRGARLAAAYLYIDGLRLGYSLSDLKHAAPRLAEIDSPEMERIAEFTRALVEEDVDALLQGTRRVADAGYRVESVHLARLALRRLATEDGVVATSEATEGLQRIAKLGGNHSSRFADLTPREIEVAELIVSGLSNPLIAETLVVSTRTVETHINRIIKKIGGKRRQDIREYLLGSNLNS